MAFRDKGLDDSGLSSDNARFAQEFLDAAYGPENPLPPDWAQILNVVGEAGEFAEAYRRYTGHARRPGSIEEVSDELADVIISAYVAAERLGVNLDESIAKKQAVIFARGFRDPRS
jgi:NTP pyrophosphatase (non-canonical NTP hydrolase)